MHDPARIRAVAVVPVYGQSAFLGESVADLLAQSAGAELAIILVDDCCPDPLTRRKCEITAAAYPGRAYYLRATENRGLSAARNAGIDLALALWPALEAVIFVDGDDRAFARFVERSLALLAQHGGTVIGDGGRIGWIYEDWHQFGVPEALQAPALYQPLVALAGCQHAPAAACAAAMFRSGLRFDETRRGGDAEDWHFWVAAHAAGWRGLHAPVLGFRYRRRVGGLAFEGSIAAVHNSARLQAEFPALYNPQAYAAHEAASGGRWLWWERPGEALAGPAPGLSANAVTMDAADLLVRLIQSPMTAAPAHALFFLGGARAALEASHLLPWCAWFLEPRGGETARVLALRPALADGETALSVLSDPADALGADAVVAVPLLTLAHWIGAGRPLAALLHQSGTRGYALAVPSPARFALGATLADHEAGLVAAFERLDRPSHPWRFEPVWRPHGLDRARLDRAHLDLEGLFCADGARGATLVVCAAVDLARRADALDLDQIAAYCRMRDATAPSLCVLGTAPIRVPLLPERFEALFLLPLPDMGEVHADPAGLFAGFGATLSLDCVEAVAAMGQVRRFGCTAIAAPLRGSLCDSPLAEALPVCFKAFDVFVARSLDHPAGAEARGVAREIIDRESLLS